MSYQCPICRNKFTESSFAMCKHFIGTFDRTEEHRVWIKSHGINFVDLLGFKGGEEVKGNYRPLMDAIEKACKIPD